MAIHRHPSKRRLGSQGTLARTGTSDPIKFRKVGISILKIRFDAKEGGLYPGITVIIPLVVVVEFAIVWVWTTFFTKEHFIFCCVTHLFECHTIDIIKEDVVLILVMIGWDVPVRDTANDRKRALTFEAFRLT